VRRAACSTGQDSGQTSISKGRLDEARKGHPGAQMDIATSASVESQKIRAE